MIQFNALVPGELHDKVCRIEPMQFSVGNLKREGVLCPSRIRNLKLLGGKHFFLVPDAQGDDDTCISAQVFGVEAACIIPRAMNGKIDLLLDARRLAGNAEDAQRLP